MLSALLTTCAVTKMVSGYREWFAVGPTVYWAMAAFEIALAVGVFSRVRRLAFVLAICLASVGTVMALFRGQRPCGCLGTLVVIDRAQQLILNGSIGALATLGLWLGGAKVPTEGRMRVSD